MSWIGEWVQEKAAQYLKAGVQAGSTLAGNAVGGVGSLVEDSGRSLGEGVTRGVNGVGDYINGYGTNIKNSMSADGFVRSATGKASATAAVVPPSSRISSPPHRPQASLSSTRVKAPTAAKGPVASKSNVNTSSSSHTTSPEALARSSKPELKPKSMPATIAVPKGRAGASQVQQPISTSQSERAANGKVKIAAASRPKPSPAMTPNSRKCNARSGLDTTARPHVKTRGRAASSKMEGRNESR